MEQAHLRVGQARPRALDTDARKRPAHPNPGMASENSEGIGHVEKAIFRHAAWRSCRDFPMYGPASGKRGGETAVTAASAGRFAGGEVQTRGRGVSQVALYNRLAETDREQPLLTTVPARELERV